MAGAPVPESVAACRWLHEVFVPATEAVPARLRGKREPAEVFHEILDHRWYLSERAGRDVGTDLAVRDYIDHVLPVASDEQRVLPVEPLDEL